MDFQPGTLLESPLVVNVIRIAPLLFAGAALFIASSVVFCVSRECRALRRSSRRNAHAGH